MNSPPDWGSPQTIYDSQGVPKPRNEKEARLLAQREFANLQLDRKQSRRQKLLELQSMKVEYDKLVAARHQAEMERREKEIDYVGEYDAQVLQQRRNQRERKGIFSSIIPRSLSDMEDRFYEKRKDSEEEFERRFGKKPLKSTDDEAALERFRASTGKNDGTTHSRDDIDDGPLPTHLIATLSETRSTAEIEMYYGQVLDQWHKTFPKRPVPDLKIKIVDRENYPFSTMVFGVTECHLTPLTLGMTTRALRKLFVKATPDFIENEQRLIDATDLFYFTPERLQFVLAKSISEAAIGGPTSPLTWIKLRIFKLLSKNYYILAREKIEMKSDTMAAHLSPTIAIGGIEHLAKLNGFYEYYQHEIPMDDDALMADVRMMNLLSIVEHVHGVKKSDAMRLALNNRVTLSGNSRNLVNSVTRSLDSKLLQEHIARNYPKVIIVDPIDGV